jgi:hypothetical protein
MPQRLELVIYCNRCELNRLRVTHAILGHAVFVWLSEVSTALSKNPAPSKRFLADATHAFSLPAAYLDLSLLEIVPTQSISSQGLFSHSEGTIPTSPTPWVAVNHPGLGGSFKHQCSKPLKVMEA